MAPEMPKIWDQQICAGELKGGKDTCVGKETLKLNFDK